jgi:hypothetical protein
MKCHIENHNGRTTADHENVRQTKPHKTKNSLKGYQIMAISVSRAGKLIIGEDGYVTATLSNIEVLDQTDEKGRERTQLEWEFAIQTTKGASRKLMWTGVNLNSDKTYRPVDDNGVVSENPEYNKLTQVLLALGVITELQLHSGEDVDIDLESLIGKSFKFKVLPQKNKPQMSDIDIKTIKFTTATTEPKRSKLTVGKSAD